VKANSRAAASASSILADAVESLVRRGCCWIAACRCRKSRAEFAGASILRKSTVQTLGKDAKTLLQEYLQGKRIPLPAYSIVATQVKPCPILPSGVRYSIIETYHTRGEGSKSPAMPNNRRHRAAYQQIDKDIND